EAGLTLDRLLNAKNAKDYAAAVDEINAALERMDKLKAGAAKFGPTKSELDQAAKDAYDVLQYMEDLRKQGEVTQDQVNAAYVAYQQALADAGSDAAKAWLEAQGGADKSAAKTKSAIDA